MSGGQRGTVDVSTGQQVVLGWPDELWVWMRCSGISRGIRERGRPPVLGFLTAIA